MQICFGQQEIFGRPILGIYIHWLHCVVPKADIIDTMTSANTGHKQVLSFPMFDSQIVQLLIVTTAIKRPLGLTFDPEGEEGVCEAGICRATKITCLLRRNLFTIRHQKLSGIIPGLICLKGATSLSFHCPKP